MRDNAWLEATLEHLWNEHFADVKKLNSISIHFGRKSLTRLGSIILTPQKISKITITSLFKDPHVPEYVVIETIVHELIHYIHGFSSELERKFKNPHQGGVIAKEMKARGFEIIHEQSKKWLKENWHEHVSVYKTPRRRRAVKRRSLFRIIHF